MKIEFEHVQVRAKGGTLAPVDLRIDGSASAFVYAFVHEDEHVLDALLGTLAGSLHPARGRVRVAGRDPSRSPQVRSRIATTYFHEPTVGLADRVIAHRRQVERIRERAGALTGPVPTALILPGDARLTELSAAERRLFALELALRLVEPLAFFLADPLRELDGPETRALLGALSHHTERRTPFVFACTSREGAARLTPHITEIRFEDAS